MRGRRPTTVLLAATVAAAACAMPGSVLAAEETAPPVEWGYEGETGPEHWGSLSPDYAACDTGRSQSPVDIPASAPVVTGDLGFAYAPAAATVVDNGHAIQVDLVGAGRVTIDGRAFELRQFHFHSPAEHTVAGADRPMEMHLVHVDDTGATAVVGVHIVEGTANAALDPILAVLPLGTGGTAVLTEPVDPDSLLPADRGAVAYAGSLTTPPCTEGVRWHVLVAPIELSPGQIAAYRAVHDGTDRPTQPLGERTFERP